MSVAIRRRRGTTAQHAAFVGLDSEITIDSDKRTIIVHDGTTPGGFPIARPGLKQTFTAQQTPMNGVLTDATNIDWNGDVNGQVVEVTLTGSRTMNAPTNIQQYALYILRVAQDATGGRILAWNSAYKFGSAGAPTLSTDANKVDILCFIGGAANTLEFVGSRLDAV